MTFNVTREHKLLCYGISISSENYSIS